MEQTAFQSSIIGYHVFGHGKPEKKPEIENEKGEEETRGRQTQIFDEEQAKKDKQNKSLFSWMATPDFIIAGLYFIVMDIRCVSYPGWTLSWFQWTFSDNPDYAQNVSLEWI